MQDRRFSFNRSRIKERDSGKKADRPGDIGERRTEQAKAREPKITVFKTIINNCDKFRKEKQSKRR